MSEKSRTIKLFCPSVSKVVPFIALEEQKLDLGTIARIFGLEPATIKLNGHFISRGIDLISSSVTWKSLISFFSSKGLSTGSNDADALIVDGKLCKAGTKRTYYSSDGEIGNHPLPVCNGLDTKRKTQLEDVNLLKKKKTKECNSDNPLDGENGNHQSGNYNGLNFKRKLLLENISPLKKRKIQEASSDSLGRQSNLHETGSSSGLTCSSSIGNLKRPREEEMIITAPYKRSR